MSNAIQQMKKLFGNPVSKMFLIIIFIDILFLGFAKDNTVHLIVSFVFTLIASCFYICISFSHNLEMKKDLYNGIFGLYESFHGIMIVSLRIGKTPVKFIAVLAVLCIISGVVILVLDLLFSKPEKYKSNKRVAAIFLLPCGGLGIYIHRLLEEKNFLYTAELAVLLLSLTFIAFYTCIIKYRLDQSNYDSLRD